MDTGPDGFSSFYQKNYTPIAALVAALLGYRHQGEDITREAFARALARWKHIDAPEAWVRRVAQRLAVDAGRPEEPDSATSTALSSALMRLPIQQRQVLVLYYLADLPVDEIAGDCGLTAGAVRIRLAAARHRLDQELGQTPAPSEDAAPSAEGIRDSELRAELAAWVHELAARPAPDLDVLRRQGRGRRLRRAAAVGAAAVVIAGVGISIGFAVQGSGGSASSHSRPAAASGVQVPRMGTWSPPEPITTADGGPSTAPWAVWMGGLPNGLAYVNNVVANTQTGEIVPPAGLAYIGAAVAGDDHTFVLAASGGPDTGFYEVHLGQTGQPGPAVLILSVPTASTPQFLDFALSPDGRMLAYTTRTGITVVSLATRKTTSWPATGGTAEELSWADDDRTLALSWFPAASSVQAQRGVRLLDTRSGGSVLQASRLVIPSRVLTPDGGYPLITSDGAEILATYYASQPEGPVAYVGEFSARTGQLLTTVTAPRSDVYMIGGSCQVMWADPSGKEVVSTCTSQGNLLYNGSVSGSSLSVALDQSTEPSPDGSISGDLQEGPQMAW